MEQLKRRNIPTLKKKKSRKGQRFIAWRSFASGHEVMRIYQGETLSLRVRFGEGTEAALVFLYSNILGQWTDYEFKRSGELEYALDLPCSRPGSSEFKIKYSLNGGKTWYWDNVPHSRVMVDPAGMRGLRAYTLIPTVSGHIGKWISELSRIKQMGFNAVHLLPLSQMDLSESPYSAFDLFHPDYSYAIPGDSRPVLDQLEDFIREAKKLGLRLCFDVVLNHVGVWSQISAYSPDWIASDTSEKDGLRRAGCWDGRNWVKWSDLVLVKYDHPNAAIREEIWDYMSDYLMFWASYASYTGGLIRLDNLHSTNPDFLGFAIAKMRSEFPELVVFAELFTDAQTTERMVFYHELNLLLATPWSAPFAAQARELIAHLHEHPRIRYLLPVNSHDSGSPAQEYGSARAVVPRYAACALLGTGQSGLVQGAEFGTPKKIEFIGRQLAMPMSASTWGHDFSGQLRAINEYAAANELFSEAGNLRFVDGNHGAALAAFRYSKDFAKVVLILLSLDTSAAHELSVPFDLPIYKDGPRKLLRDCLARPGLDDDPGRGFGPAAFFVSEGYARFRLEPCEVKIFEVEVSLPIQHKA